MYAIANEIIDFLRKRGKKGFLVDPRTIIVENGSADVSIVNDKYKINIHIIDDVMVVNILEKYGHYGQQCKFNMNDIDFENVASSISSSINDQNNRYSIFDEDVQ